MYGLPTSTERKQQLPKKAIYAKFDLPTARRENFDADIARIDIVAVISPATIPALGEGAEVKGVYVVDVQMKRREYDAKNILLLNRLIAQNMLFALRYEDQVQFAIFHTKLFTTVWQPVEHATLPLSGLNLDAVWENMVKHIGQIEVAGDNSLAQKTRLAMMTVFATIAGCAVICGFTVWCCISLVNRERQQIYVLDGDIPFLAERAAVDGGGLDARDAKALRALADALQFVFM